MWIVTARGFVSVVRKPWDREEGTLTVRARRKGDLTAAFGLHGSEIQQDDASDYRYRVRLDEHVVAMTVAGLVLGIDYANFKDAVQARQGAARAGLYHQVWATLQRLQALDAGLPVFEREPKPKRKAKRRRVRA